MTNHSGAQPNDNQAVIIELPNGSTEKIAVRDRVDLTVRDLKVTCELQFGIPCNLQQLCALENPGQELNDWSPLKRSKMLSLLFKYPCGGTSLFAFP